MRSITAREVLGITGILFVMYSLYLFVGGHSNYSAIPELIGLFIISFTLFSKFRFRKYAVFLFVMWILAGFGDVRIWERHGMESTVLESFVLNAFAVVTMLAGYYFGKKYYGGIYDVWKKENKVRYSYAD